jgi:hypothetical protein
MLARNEQPVPTIGAEPEHCECDWCKDSDSPCNFDCDPGSMCEGCRDSALVRADMLYDMYREQGGY